MTKVIGQNIVLRAYREADIPAMYKWNQDKDTTQWMGPRFRQPRSLEDISASVHSIMDKPPADGAFFVIAERSSEAYLGGIDLTSIDLVDRNAVVSLVVATLALRNRGIGRAALGLLMDFAFTRLKLHKLELGVNANNHAAIACYQKLGFTVEGIIRDHSFIDGSYSDLYRMGIVETEYVAYPGISYESIR